MYILVDALSIVASLVGSTAPSPVRLTLNGLSEGQAVTVTPVTASGATWAVPGGTFVASGAQHSLIDNRTALNVPFRYRVTIAGLTYTSNEVTVASAGRYLIQSLDGSTVAEFVWRDNALPRDLVVNSTTVDVPGRRRPPVRYAAGGDGGGELELRTDRANSDRLEGLLLSGRPLVVRTDGQVRDVAPVELILPRGGRSVLWGATTRGGGSDRVWSIPYLLVDDPEPSTPLSAFTWADYDAAVDGMTGADFDALFASWADFDVTDWSQYL